VRIHGLTVDRGGCRFYRIEQPFAALERMGHTTSYGVGLTAEQFETADVIVTQFMLEERNVETWEALARKGSHALVYEVDDDLFTIHAVASSASAYRKPETAGRIRRAMAAADLVTVTTPYLAELYSKVNPNVTVLPNCVPDWMPERPMPPTGTNRTVIGWPCSPSHIEDWQVFAPILVRFLARRPDVTCRFWGPKDAPDIPKIQRRCFGWQPDVTTYLKSLSMDIGIAPLADLKFNYGKSGIKALEYAALGVPAVCSDFDQYRSMVLEGITGLLCRTQHDWMMALGQLADDDDYRAELGRRALDWARGWTIGRHAHKWEAAYKSIL